MGQINPAAREREREGHFLPWAAGALSLLPEMSYDKRDVKGGWRAERVLIGKQLAALRLATQDGGIIRGSEWLSLWMHEHAVFHPESR